MSAQKTKFPTKSVPARRMHQGTTIVGKNGLPIDAVATLEPGTTIMTGQPAIVSYSEPTVTVANSVDLTTIINYYNFSSKHTKILLFTDNTSQNYFIDPSSINNTTKTFNIYKDEAYSISPPSIGQSTGWFVSEAELVNRLQTTTSAVIDSVEFRDIDIRFQLDGDPVKIVDSEGHELDIQPDGSLTFSPSPVTSHRIDNIPIVNANVEQSFSIPDGTRRLRLSLRGNGKLQIAYTSGETGTNFITVPPGNVYEEKDISMISKILYFRSSKPNEVLEILSWT